MIALQKRAFEKFLDIIEGREGTVVNNFFTGFFIWRFGIQKN